MKILFCLICLANSAFATILPENNYAIPISMKNEGLSEFQYNLVIDKVLNVYRPIVAREGKEILANRLWEDPRVNAGTYKLGNQIVINLYGGYARHASVTEDGYALVICHELGHHLGGMPRKIFADEVIGWPSTEGQADYFATLKCLRKIFRKDDNVAVIGKLKVPDAIKGKCNIFRSKWEKALCIRTTLAGLSVSEVSADIRNQPIPDIETPDQNVVEETFEAHPSPQCRLDTYFQGSICKVSSGIRLSMIDEVKGTCHPIRNYKDGQRPLCWFKPKKIGPEKPAL